MFGLLSLGGCATAPDSPLAPKQPPAPPVTQTVYVPVYVEVEKPAPTPPPPEPIRLPEDQDQTLSLLAEMTRASNASAEDLRKELVAAGALFNKERSHVNRLRYAWLSALLGPAAGDDARLQGLLEPLLAKGSGLVTTHPLRPVADLLLAQIAERGRQVREEQKRADALQQKLDALKAIERQMLDRERRRN
ncbi:MAG: hypothetical protein JNL19_01040 [Burkholderiales bacterium]|nr:hypothetical protein [Burkholderiales bacterium]